MYAFIRGMHRPVTREEAATATGISRRLAAFHLDKLVDVGLLQVHTRPAQRVRRVGRRPKVYEPTDPGISVTIPTIRHDVLAEMLLDAMVQEPNRESVRQAALRTADQRGMGLGDSAYREGRPGRRGAERALTAAAGILDGLGFDPVRVSADCLRLANCPFRPFAAKDPGLVCGMNHAFLSGLLRGLRVTSVSAYLRPEAGGCCVELRAGQGAAP